MTMDCLVQHGCMTGSTTTTKVEVEWEEDPCHLLLFSFVVGWLVGKKKEAGLHLWWLVGTREWFKDGEHGSLDCHGS